MPLFNQAVQSAVPTTAPLSLAVLDGILIDCGIDYTQIADHTAAWERFRARRNPGTAIAASNAMIATTIMISTRVKPSGFVL